MNEILMAVVIVLLVAGIYFLVIVGNGSKSVIPIETIIVGQPYSHAFNLTFQAAPEQNLSKGYIERYDCSTYVADTMGSIKWIDNGTIVNTSKYVGMITWTPMDSGTFIGGALCKKRSILYDNETKAWGNWSAPADLASDAIRIEVARSSAQATPQISPQPTAVEKGWFDNFMEGIKSWLCKTGGTWCA